jgi:arginase family enzyme
MTKEEEEKQFKNVATKKFKGEFVNYYKHSPEKIMENIRNKLIEVLRNNKLPFVFGGSKEGMLAAIDAFHETCKDPNKTVYILSGKPFL